MSKVDWSMIILLTAFIGFCFWMDSKWWFFMAGFCASVVFAIGIGHLLQSAEHHQSENSWDTFLDKMNDKNPLPEKSNKAVSVNDN